MNEQAANAMKDLVNYGAIGIVATLCIAAVIVMARWGNAHFKRTVEDKDRQIAKLEKEITDLRADIEKYLKKMIEDSEKAINGTQIALFENASMLEQLKVILEKRLKI